MMSFRSLIVSLALVLPGSALAHVPVLVTPEGVNEVVPIQNPTVSTAYYGILDDFPHMYSLQVSEPLTLRVETLVPDIPSARNTVNSIIVKRVGRQGGVTEVARLLGKDASWESFFEPWGGDSYRRGVTYEATLEAGDYRIEVSTPDNDTKYVLVVGREETWGSIGYFEMLGRIMDVKEFFGKSRIRVVESPFAYVPLGILLIALGGYYLYRRRSHNS